jgi:hypothetical protein
MQGNVSSNFFARGFGVKNEGNLPANLQSNRLSPPSLTLKGAAAETAMFTVLEGVSGGLDALIATLKKNGDWPRVRAIRDKLIEVFATIAVDVYAYQEGMHCLWCSKVNCSVLSLKVLCCTGLHCFYYSTAVCLVILVLHCSVLPSRHIHSTLLLPSLNFALHLPPNLT